jgi:coatomer subunit alpha
VAFRSLQAITSGELLDAYRLVVGAKLAEAAALFRSILLSLLLVVPTSPSELNQVRHTSHLVFVADSDLDGSCKM